MTYSNHWLITLPLVDA